MSHLFSSLALIAAGTLAFGCAPATISPSPAPSVSTSTSATTEPFSTAADHFFASGDVSLRYREIGRGEPVVLLHGYGRSLEDWGGLADSLASTHRVIALDVRGFGRSTKSADPERYTAAVMAEDVVKLLDHLRLPRAHLVGHSMGAVLAANVAARHPSRVATAALVAGPFFPDSVTTERFNVPFIEALERGEGLREFIAWIYPALPDSAAQAASDARMAVNDLGSLLAVFRAFPGLTVTPPLARGVRAPTLVIVGTDDRLADYSRQLAAWWPGARLVEVAGANHGSVLAHPLLLEEIRSLMASQRISLGTETEARFAGGGIGTDPTSFVLRFAPRP